MDFPGDEVTPRGSGSRETLPYWVGKDVLKYPMLRSILGRRGYDIGGLEHIPDEPSAREEWASQIMRILTEEYLAAGVDHDYEPTEYGRQVEELEDRIRALGWPE